MPFSALPNDVSAEVPPTLPSAPLVQLRSTIALAWIPVAVGAMVFSGWAARVPALTSFLPGRTPMLPNAALCMAALGAGVLIRRRYSWAAQALAIAVLSLAAITLIQYAAGFGSVFDRWLFDGAVAASGNSHGGRIAPNTAAIFVLLSASLLCLARGRRHWALWLTTGGAMPAVLAFLGYLYGVRGLYAVGSFTAMSFPATVAFSALCGALLTESRDKGWMSVVSSNHPGGLFARRMIPAAFLLTALFGYVRLVGQRYGLYETEMGTALHVFFINAVFLMVIVGNASRLSRAEEERVKVLDDLKSARDALEEKVKELERSNQELEQFAYIASHDLQEPLRAVASYTQLLGQRYKGKLDQDADEFIEFAVDGARRMQRLIEDLLTYSRAGRKPLQWTPVPLQTLVADIVSYMQPRIDELGAAVVWNDLPVVRADETQMTQLFQNLIGNALKFTSKEAPRVEISAKPDGRRWVIGVKDNGIGIDPRFKDRIFRMFQRLHDRDKYPGSGIGLAVCQKIVERHGGKIWFESAPNQGTTFFVTLTKEKTHA